MSVDLLTPKESDCPIYQPGDDPGEKIGKTELLDLISQDPTDAADLCGAQEGNKPHATSDPTNSPLGEQQRVAKQLGLQVDHQTIELIAKDANVARSWLKKHCGGCALEGTCQTNQDLLSIVSKEEELANTLERKNEEAKPIVRLSKIFGRWHKTQKDIDSRTSDMANHTALIKQANELQHSFTEELLELEATEERDKLVENVHKRIKGEGLKDFPEFMSGVVCEVVVHDILKEIGDSRGWNVEKASAEQDIHEGTDFLITTPEGRLIRVDAKSRNAFRKLTHGRNEYVDRKTISTQNGGQAGVILVNPEGNNDRRSIIETNSFRHGKEIVKLPSFNHESDSDNVRVLRGSILRAI